MKRKWWTVVIILTVIILAIVIIKSRGGESVEDKIAKCIGENSVLYVQYGCHACAIQEEIFGESYQYLNVVDCVYEPKTCLEKEIEATPTWIIDGEKYRSVQSIGNLQVLTGC